MKTLPVVLLESAIADLSDTALFIANQSQSLDVGLSFTARIERKCHEIGNVPFGGVDRPEFGKGIQMTPFENSAVILYRVYNDVVEIVRVFYGGQNYDTIMGSQR